MLNKGNLKFQMRVDNIYYMWVNTLAQTATDELKYHSGQKYSTFDKDNDQNNTLHCAQYTKSGWWFKNCLRVNLNGVYNVSGRMRVTAVCMHWGTRTPLSGYAKNSLLFTEMKVRRNIWNTTIQHFSMSCLRQLITKIVFSKLILLADDNRFALHVASTCLITHKWVNSWRPACQL